MLEYQCYYVTRTSQTMLMVEELIQAEIPGKQGRKLINRSRATCRSRKRIE